MLQIDCVVRVPYKKGLSLFYLILNLGSSYAGSQLILPHLVEDHHIAAFQIRVQNFTDRVIFILKITSYYDNLCYNIVNVLLLHNLMLVY